MVVWWRTARPHSELAGRTGGAGVIAAAAAVTAALAAAAVVAELLLLLHPDAIARSTSPNLAWRWSFSDSNDAGLLSADRDHERLQSPLEAIPLALPPSGDPEELPSIRQTKPSSRSSTTAPEFQRLGGQSEQAPGIRMAAKLSRRGVVNGAKSAVQTVGNGIKNAVQKVGNKIKDVAVNVGTKIKDTAVKIGTKIKVTAVNVGNKIKDVAVKVWDKYGGVIKTVGKIATKVGTAVASNAAGLVFGPAAKAAVNAGLTFVGDFAWNMADGKSAKDSFYMAVKDAAIDAGINAGAAALDSVAPGAGKLIGAVKTGVGFAAKATTGTKAFAAARAAGAITGKAGIGSIAALKKPSTLRTAASNIAQKAANWRTLAKSSLPSPKGVTQLASTMAKGSLKSSTRQLKKEIKSGIKREVKRAIRQQKKQLLSEVQSRVKNAAGTAVNRVFASRSAQGRRNKKRQRRRKQRQQRLRAMP
ncbi:hypothetical protein HK405_002779 [Cladochytrium tenue]|nr:hypothetical protein HK405_002779 [Cladochytrium tenue]